MIDDSKVSYLSNFILYTILGLILGAISGLLLGAIIGEMMSAARHGTENNPSHLWYCRIDQWSRRLLFPLQVDHPHPHYPSVDRHHSAPRTGCYDLHMDCAMGTSFMWQNCFCRKRQKRSAVQLRTSILPYLHLVKINPTSPKEPWNQKS